LSISVPDVCTGKQSAKASVKTVRKQKTASMYRDLVHRLPDLETEQKCFKNLNRGLEVRRSLPASRAQRWLCVSP
jgi:hypothetical protein